MLGCAAILASSCAPPAPKPLSPVAKWKNYRSSGGGFSFEVPADWTISERGGAGGYETTISAGANSSLIVAQQMLPGAIEGRLMRSASADDALIGLVQSHYSRLEQQYQDFHGAAPVTGTLANMFAGSGTFTCRRQGGFMRPELALQGRTAVLVGLDNLYVVDALGDDNSWNVVSSAFDRAIATFKREE